MFVSFIGVPIFKSMDKGVKSFCESQYKSNSNIYTYKLQRGSIGFYCKSKVEQINNQETVLAFLSKPEQFYLITRKKDFKNLESFLLESYAHGKLISIKENDDYIFLENKN